MSSSLIIFEGPECVGKSTIVNRLAEQYSARIQKGVRIANRFLLTASVIADINAQVTRTRCGGGEAIVLMDRWNAISDIVYEKYCYCKESIMEQILPDCLDLISKNRVIVVYLHITKEEMLDRFDRRGDLLRTRDEAEMVYGAYEQLFSTRDTVRESSKGLRPFGVIPADSYVPNISIDISGMSKEEAYTFVESTLIRTGYLTTKEV